MALAYVLVGLLIGLFAIMQIWSVRRGYTLAKQQSLPRPTGGRLLLLLLPFLVIGGFGVIFGATADDASYLVFGLLLLLASGWLLLSDWRATRS